MKIAMIGAGYVGLVSGACFSDFGHDVICVDLDQGKIDALDNGVMPIFATSKPNLPFAPAPVPPAPTRGTPCCQPPET